MKNISIIDRDEKLLKSLKKELKVDNEIEVQNYMPEKLRCLLKKTSDVLIINEDSLYDTENIINICNKVRKNEDNSITPIIIVSSNCDINHESDVLKSEANIYLKTPINGQILYYSIKSVLRLINSNRQVSPLTGLPGNDQIQKELAKRIEEKQKFAMLYIDLDNFKAYNDTYGFEKGDVIIKFTANIITKYVLKNKNEDNFVGHIGGDDFVAITVGDDFEEISQDIIAEFDANIKKYLNKEDIEKGYIEVENRRGIIEQFPLPSISIGIVIATKDRFKNPLELGEVGASVKHLAKTIYGSTYVIDRRKS